MLRTMRKDFKKYSFSLWLVIIAFIGGFVLLDGFKGKSIDKTGLVYVNKEVMVRSEEFHAQLLRTLDNYKNQFKQNFNKSMIDQLRIPEQILQGMVNTAVIRTEAAKLNLTATDEELKQKIITYPAFQQDGQFIGLENYERTLAYQRMTTLEFEAQLKEDIIREKFQQLITGSLVIDDETLREAYVKDKDKAEMDYFILRPEKIKSEIKVEDNDPAIKAYYESHKENFKTQERRAGYVIAYKYNDFKKEVKVDEKDVRDYFKNNRGDFIIPGKTKVSRILLNFDATNREEILKKATALQMELNKDNFAEKAKVFSEDNMAQQGGDHGYTAWKQFSDQEVSMVESMKQGQISTPIGAPSGFSIVYVSEKVDERQQSLDDVRGKIQESLQYDKLNDLVSKKLEKIYKKLENVENIKAKATELNVKVIETELLTAGSPVKNIDEMGYVSRQLFSMKEKEVLFPVQFADGIAIAQVAKIEKPVVEQFDKVKAMVKSKVEMTKKIDLLMADAKKYIAELAAITDETKRTEYLKANALTSESTTYKKGNILASLPEKDGLDDVIFGSPVQQYSEPIRFEESIVFYKLKSKTITTPQDFMKDRAEFYQTKLNEMRSNYFASYMSNRMKSYEVTLNQELYAKTKEEVLSRFN